MNRIRYSMAEEWAELRAAVEAVPEGPTLPDVCSNDPKAPQPHPDPERGEEPALCELGNVIWPVHLWTLAGVCDRCHQLWPRTAAQIREARNPAER